MNERFEKLQEYLSKIRHFDEAVALQQWDLQVMSPAKGVDAKIELIRFYSEERFKLATADEFGELLEEFAVPEELAKLAKPMQFTIKRNLRDYTRFKRMPKEFYTELVETSARSQKAWEEAKHANDFALFEPWLDKMIALTKQQMAYMEPDEDPYEVLLDMFEAGMDSKTIERIFDEVKEGLPPLLEKINAAPKPDLSVMEGYYDIDAQKKVQNLLLEYIGFDFEGGLTAESEHPFTETICPGDVRITNHFEVEQPLSAVFTSIHEGGHAIFEQNIGADCINTSAADMNLMGLHESQSRFYENVMGRNKNFWLPIYDKVAELLPPLQNVPLDTFVKAINDVRPSFIRIDADEVTYCMHIVLRFEMEKAIFRDNVPTSELKELWNDKMEELLGIRPETDADGILQDVHWSDGSFGYFPSYLLGSVYDGMLLEAIEADLGSLDVLLAEGRVKEVTKWLNEKIHKNGSLYNSKEVLARVCGDKEITAKPLLKYFNDKYSKVYGF